MLITCVIWLHSLTVPNFSAPVNRLFLEVSEEYPPSIHSGNIVFSWLWVIVKYN